MREPIDVTPVCTERYVAFLDFLGFKYEVEQAEQKTVPGSLIKVSK